MFLKAMHIDRIAFVASARLADRFESFSRSREANLRDIERLRPSGNETPVILMMSYAPDTGISAGPDPIIAVISTRRWT